jgi:PhnB protein
MAIKGGRPVDRRISLTLFVRHGDEDRAIRFYRDAFGAEILFEHTLQNGTLSGADVRIGESIVTIAGANPNRDVEPSHGGPCSPHALGTATTIQNLYVADADAAIGRALDAGARLRNPVQDTAWGDRAGVVVDPFGHIWTFATAIADVEFADIPARMRRLAEENRSARGSL